MPSIMPQPMGMSVLENKIPTLRCDNCKNDWLEQIMVSKYDQHAIAIGLKKPNIVDKPQIYLFRCIKCGTILEHQVPYTGNNHIQKLWEDVMETIGRRNTKPEASAKKAAPKAKKQNTAKTQEKEKNEDN